MSDEVMKKLDEINEVVKDVKQYIPLLDIVTNKKYCEIRTARGASLTVDGLKKWFEKGCPRVDSQHVSIMAVDKWAEENNTRKPKKKI